MIEKIYRRMIEQYVVFMMVWSALIRPKMCLKFKDLTTMYKNNTFSLLHFLAFRGEASILNIPETYTLKDNVGITPLFVLAFRIKDFDDILKLSHVIHKRDEKGNTILHYLASSSNIAINNNLSKLLKHKDISSICNDSCETPLHKLAFKRCIEILNHPDVGIAFGSSNELGSPLHILTSLICMEENVDETIIKKLLSHPNISKTRYRETSLTPLHIMAMYKVILVVTHPDATVVKDRNGATPVDYLIM